MASDRTNQKPWAVLAYTIADDKGGGDSLYDVVVPGQYIIPVMVKDPVKCKQISDWLLDRYGIYIQPINYPTVPRGTERLRITPSPLHTDADIDKLVSALSELWSQCALSRSVKAA